MKILVQAYKFPPVNHPGSIRLYFLVREWISRGAQVFVQTSANQDVFPQDPTLQISGIKIQQIDTRDLRGLFSGQARENTVNTRLRRMYHSFPFVYWVGDGGRTYIRQSIRSGSELIQKEKITHVFSSYRPWSDHIVASALKNKFPNVEWIADFRDRPIDPIRRDSWWPGLQEKYQRRLIRQADVLCTVSEGLAQYFRSLHSKVVVVRNGLPTPATGFLSAPLGTHFTMTYTGKLYPNLQTLAPLFQVLRELINEGELNPAHLELHYAGRDGERWAKWAGAYTLRHFCVDHGWLSFRQSQQLQQNSQINLLCSWSAEGYNGVMTSKLGHYLAAGRPIIAVLNGPLDPELDAAITTSKAGYLYHTGTIDQKTRLKDFILQLYRTWAFSGAIPWRISPDLLPSYTWSTQVNHLLSHLSL